MYFCFINKCIDNKKEEFLDYLEKLVQSSEFEISSITDENDDGKDSDTYVFVEKEESSVANTATILSKNMRKGTIKKFFFIIYLI